MKEHIRRACWVAVLIVASAGPGVPASASAAPLDGHWKLWLDYPCKASDKACLNRPSDWFALYLWSSGNHICGQHQATAYFGNQVDEDEGADTSIFGTFNGNQAEVAWKSSWGGSGHAKLDVEGGRLKWHVTDKDEGVSYYPVDAVLMKTHEKPTPWGPSATCKG